MYIIINDNNDNTPNSRSFNNTLNCFYNICKYKLGNCKLFIYEA